MFNAQSLTMDSEPDPDPWGLYDSMLFSVNEQHLTIHIQVWSELPPQIKQKGEEEVSYLVLCLSWPGINRSKGEQNDTKRQT